MDEINFQLAFAVRKGQNHQHVSNVTTDLYISYTKIVREIGVSNDLVGEYLDEAKRYEKNAKNTKISTKR